MNPDFIQNLNDVLKYSSDTVENLLTQLASPEHNHTRWGGEKADHTFRGVLADALDERGRDKEAELLRNPDQHVLLRKGIVRPATFDGMPILNAARAYADALGDDTTGGDPLDELHIAHPNGYYRDVDYDTPPVRALPHEVNITRIDENGAEPHSHYIVPYDQLAGHLADHINDYADFDDAPDPEREQTLNNLERHLRTAPYEKVDKSHPSESIKD